jgi:hypothetical protein
MVRRAPINRVSRNLAYSFTGRISTFRESRLSGGIQIKLNQIAAAQNHIAQASCGHTKGRILASFRHQQWVQLAFDSDGDIPIRTLGGFWT